ncbi:MAG: hypothetical protein LUH04_12485 [Clostridium sp.]|nr:hypothetical protein [Clostridium sp.]
MDDVINNYCVGTIITPPVEHTTKTFEDSIDALSTQGLNLTGPKVGNTYQIGCASYDIIASNNNYDG